MSIAAYCRVSTARQKADSQVSEIKKWLAAHGYDESEVEWYIDKQTGKHLQRPNSSGCNGIFLLAGSLRSSCGSWIAYLAVFEMESMFWRIGERGLKIVVITQQLELNGAIGRMIAAVMLGLAEIELEYRQRTTDRRHRSGETEGHLQGQEMRHHESKARPSKRIGIEGVAGVGSRNGSRHQQEND